MPRYWLDGRGLNQAEPGLSILSVESRDANPGALRDPAFVPHGRPHPCADTAGDGGSAECPDQVSVDEAAIQGAQGGGGSLPAVALATTVAGWKMPRGSDGALGERLSQAGRATTPPGPWTKAAPDERAGASLSRCPTRTGQLGIRHGTVWPRNPRRRPRRRSRPGPYPAESLTACGAHCSAHQQR